MQQRSAGRTELSRAELSRAEPSRGDKRPKRMTTEDRQTKGLHTGAAARSRVKSSWRVVKGGEGFCRLFWNRREDARDWDNMVRGTRRPWRIESHKYSMTAHQRCSVDVTNCFSIPCLCVCVDCSALSALVPLQVDCPGSTWRSLDV